MALSSYDTQVRTWLEIFSVGPQVLQSQSMLFPSQRSLQRVQTFVGFSTGSDLQNGSQAVIHRIKVQREGRLFRQQDEVWKKGLHQSCVIYALWAGAKSYWNVQFASTTCCWAPRSTTALKAPAAVNFLVDVQLLIHANEGVLPLVQNPPQTITQVGFYNAQRWLRCPKLLLAASGWFFSWRPSDFAALASW